MLEILSKKNGRFSGVMRNITPSVSERKEGQDTPSDLKQEVVEIPLQQIFLNPQQPRKIFREEELAQLATSIRDYGVLQPILVKPAAEGTFCVIAGERRYRAACQAGLFTIPAIVRSMEEEEAALVALVENVQRENLGYLEEARAYKKLMDDFGLTQSEIAQKVGKQQSTISNKIRILSLPEDIQELLTEHRLTERHARALLRVQGENDRRKVIARVIKNNLNVKQTEKLVEDLLLGQEAQKRKKNKVNYISYKIYVNTVRNAFLQIKEMENNAIFSQEDKGDVLELKITIPKKDRCFT
ncbi:MAG: ParB/RepB/Spo0J family partition protein [Anaerovoracaceae bacterium]